MSDIRTFGPTETAVLVAFRSAECRNLEPAACYRAGVDAWRRLHPHHTATYAARHAVRLILETRGPQLMAIDVR